MARATTPAARWTTLDGLRTAFIDRCEKYSRLTLRKICPEASYDQNTEENSNDWQSVGATAVNHMSNRMMLTMFAPSRPAFRLDPTQKLIEQAEAAGMNEAAISELLSTAEHKATRLLDKRQARPKLYEAMKHLIVTGNVLLRLDTEDMRAMGIKKYCVKRSISGKVIELVIKEDLLFDELEQAAQAAVLAGQSASQYQDDSKVSFFIWVCWRDGKYRVTQWVDDTPLGGNFDGAYSEKDLPYRALTWDLSDSADYGTGLVEEYAGEFEALSTMSEATVQAAVLASEFRWLANPAGMTSVNDVLNSANGSVIPGVKGDLEIITAGKVGELEVMLRLAEIHVQRIGRGFLMNSAMTRDAERVTAEEIRLMATELETGHGGVYSRLAIDFQEPVVMWLLKESGLKLNDKEFEPIIITGLDALSRNGDLENLKLFLADFASLTAIPPIALERLRLDAIASDLATGRGLLARKYVLTDAEVSQSRAQQTQQAVLQEGAMSAAQSAGEQVGNPE